MLNTTSLPVHIEEEVTDNWTAMGVSPVQVRTLLGRVDAFQAQTGRVIVPRPLWIKWIHEVCGYRVRTQDVLDIMNNLVPWLFSPIPETKDAAK